MKRRKFTTGVYWCFYSVSTSLGYTAKQREKTAKNKHKTLLQFSLESDIYMVSFRYTHSEKSIQATTNPLQFLQIRGGEHTRENNHKLQTTFWDNISKNYICRIYTL